MKKKAEEDKEGDLRPEYDFGSLRVVARGPKRKRPDEPTPSPDRGGSIEPGA